MVAKAAKWVASGVMQLRKRADYSDGREHSTERNVRDADGNLADPSKREGDLLDPYPLRHVELMADPPERWEAPDHYLAAAIAEGWASMGRGQITLHLEPDDLTYRIDEVPGRYDDPDEPSGYRVSSAYRCTLEKVG